ncbi:MAG: hypothetical protein Q4P30_00465 [Eubacteriales bacterium]|nr:hypothetical protein [Eubacteriales bacterium]
MIIIFLSALAVFGYCILNFGMNRGWLPAALWFGLILFWDAAALVTWCIGEIDRLLSPYLPSGLMMTGITAAIAIVIFYLYMIVTVAIARRHPSIYGAIHAVALILLYKPAVRPVLNKVTGLMTIDGNVLQKIYALTGTGTLSFIMTGVNITLIILLRQVFAMNMNKRYRRTLQERQQAIEAAHYFASGAVPPESFRAHDGLNPTNLSYGDSMTSREPEPEELFFMRKHRDAPAAEADDSETVSHRKF